MGNQILQILKFWSILKWLNNKTIVIRNYFTSINMQMDDVSLIWYPWSCKVIVFLTVNWSLIYILLWLQRNYRFFYMFILTSTILCVYVFAFSWVNILEKDHNIWKAMSEDVPSVILMVYCFIAVWFVGGLSVFHFYLICTNQVTFLLLKYIKELKKKKIIVYWLLHFFQW